MTIVTNKILYANKNLDGCYEFGNRTENSVEIPEGAEFFVEDYILDRSGGTWGESGLAFLVSSEKYAIFDYISLDDVAERY